MKKILLLVVFCCCGFISQAQDELPPPTLQEMADEALKKVQDLGVYIQTIVDKENPIKNRKRAIDMACRLFADEENNKIQTRVEMKPKIYKDTLYKIRDYFDRIYYLQYDKVKIEWYEVGYSENLKKRDDGKYYAVIIIKQRFTGITKGEQKPHSSEVYKKIQVILEKQTTITETVKSKWTVLLGDISVTEDNKN